MRGIVPPDTYYIFYWIWNLKSTFVGDRLTPAVIKIYIQEIYMRNLHSRNQQQENLHLEAAPRADLEKYSLKI